MHRVQRRIVNNVYSIAALKELEPYVDSAIGHFMGIMRQKQGRSLDLGVWVQLLAFGILPSTTFINFESPPLTPSQTSSEK